MGLRRRRKHEQHLADLHFEPVEDAEHDPPWWRTFIPDVPGFDLVLGVLGVAVMLAVVLLISVVVTRGFIAWLAAI